MNQASGLTIPDSSGPIFTTCHDASASGVDGASSDLALMPFQNVEEVARQSIPDPHGPTIGCDNTSPIGADRTGPGGALSFERVEKASRLAIPDPSGPATCCD